MSYATCQNTKINFTDISRDWTSIKKIESRKNLSNASIVKKKFIVDGKGTNTDDGSQRFRNAGNFTPDNKDMLILSKSSFENDLRGFWYHKSRKRLNSFGIP